MFQRSDFKEKLSFIRWMHIVFRLEHDFIIFIIRGRCLSVSKNRNAACAGYFRVQRICKSISGIHEPEPVGPWIGWCSTVRRKFWNLGTAMHQDQENFQTLLHSKALQYQTLLHSKLIVHFKSPELKAITFILHS